MTDEEERINKIAQNASTVVDWNDVDEETRTLLETCQKEARRTFQERAQPAH